MSPFHPFTLSPFQIRDCARWTRIVRSIMVIPSSMKPKIGTPVLVSGSGARGGGAAPAALAGGSAVGVGAPVGEGAGVAVIVAVAVGDGLAVIDKASVGVTVPVA